MKRTVSIMLGVMLFPMALFAQPPASTDFSGTWVFDQTATAENAIFAKMQPGPIFGDSFVAEQSATTLTLRISAGTLQVVAVYALDGSASRNTSPPAIQNTQPIEVTSHAKWHAGRLIITSNSQSPSANGPVVVDSTRTMWLDAAGRLVIERTGTPKTMVPSSRSVYKKVQ